MSPFTKLMECRVQSRGEPKEEGSGEAGKGGEKRREQTSICRCPFDGEPLTPAFTTSVMVLAKDLTILI